MSKVIYACSITYKPCFLLVFASKVMRMLNNNYYTNLKVLAKIANTNIIILSKKSNDVSEYRNSRNKLKLQ